ncbi:MAG: hypothetical protein DRI86_02760 [Bacteroidetes bacterium]|nr:MAG: hypothetical protein DRI86_02760 [Bacteroidota bacterium]
MLRIIALLKIILASIFILSISLSYAQEKKFSAEMLDNPTKFGKDFERLFNLNELEVYDTTAAKGRIVLNNGYAQSKIINGSDWPAYSKNIIVTQIDVVYTKYPRNKEFWRTNYYSLLAKRVKALFALDSTLNCADFEWNIKYQTSCETEEETKKMFHGISIHYFEISDFEEDKYVKNIPDTKAEDIPELSLKVENYIRSQGGIGDSMVYRTFDNHPEWKNALVVMDWTGSMYRYGAQAILWHSMNYTNSGIKNFVFFNDGDDTPDERKIIGETEGVYYAQARHMDRLIKTFYLVGRKGKGGDDPENDIEALIRGINRFEDFDELILIADNNSCIRDFRLIANLGVKVNVIACGTSHGLNPQYVNLAYLTGGSVHTLDEEIQHLSQKIVDNELDMKRLKYELNNEKLFQIKDPPQRIRFSQCDIYTTLLPFNVERKLDFIEKHGGESNDSTVYTVLDRHPAWNNTSIIMDWTKNMYTQSGQALLWHKTHPKTSGINHFVFSNDGNRLADNKKKIGKTGGIYFSKSNNQRQIDRRCEYAAKRGDNKSRSSTNTIESVIYTQNKYFKTDEFILIANNETCVRDFALINNIGLPIKVILTNIKGPINPQYINIAFKSGGSLHTMDDDYYNYVFKAIATSTKNIVINGVSYNINDEGFFNFQDTQLIKKSKCSISIKTSLWEKLGF